MMAKDLMFFTLVRFKSRKVLSSKEFIGLNKMLNSANKCDHELVETYIRANWNKFQEIVRKDNIRLHKTCRN